MTRTSLLGGMALAVALGSASAAGAVAPSGDKVYRHPTFYAIPDDVPHM